MFRGGEHVLVHCTDPYSSCCHMLRINISAFVANQALLINMIISVLLQIYGYHMNHGI